MAPRVQEHITERITDFPRRRQKPEVIPIREHASRTPRYPVDGAGEARADRHHAATQRFAVAGFDDEVSVIALQGVVRQAEPRTDAAGGEAAFDFTHDTYGAKRRKVRPQTKRHVRRERLPERLALGMR